EVFLPRVEYLHQRVPCGPWASVKHQQNRVCCVVSADVNPLLDTAYRDKAGFVDTAAVSLRPRWGLDGGRRQQRWRREYQKIVRQECSSTTAWRVLGQCGFVSDGDSASVSSTT